MSKFAVTTSNLSTKNRIGAMNTILSTVSFFKEAGLKLLATIKGNKSTSNTDEKVYFSCNYGIINLPKLRTKKAASGSVKTIEEFDLAGCFDKSEIIAARVGRNRYLWSYRDNLIREESRYDREREDREDCLSKNNHQHQRQINQGRDN